MAPDPTQAYFNLQKIRGRPAFDSGAFWPNPKRFFWLEREKN